MLWTSIFFSFALSFTLAEEWNDGSEEATKVTFTCTGSFPMSLSVETVDCNDSGGGCEAGAVTGTATISDSSFSVDTCIMMQQCYLGVLCGSAEETMGDLCEQLEIGTDGGCPADGVYQFSLALSVSPYVFYLGSAQTMTCPVHWDSKLLVAQTQALTILLVPELFLWLAQQRIGTRDKRDVVVSSLIKQQGCRYSKDVDGVSDLI